MDFFLSSKNCGIFLILTICYSCSKGDENNIIGEWNLKSMESTCLQGSLNEDFEIFNSNDLCCISLSTTEINDTIEITYTTTSCQKLIFKDDFQLEIISESDTSRDTSTFTYQISDTNIEVCPIASECVNYTLSNDEIELILPIVTLSGLTCKRKFIFRK